MPRTATGVDVGLRTAKLVRGYVKDNSFVVTGFALSSYAADAPTQGWSQLEPRFKPTRARVGVTGRDVNLRYTRVPRVPDWQLRKLMRFEVEEVGGQSGTEVASDFNVLPELPEIEGEDVVVLGMARESMLAEHLAGLAALGGSLDAFTPNAIALYNAWLHYGVVMEDTVMVANIGHDNIDVILARGTDLLFARNMTGGSRLFDEALAQRFNVSAAKGEQLKCELATLEPGASYTDSNQEKASRACLAPAGQLLSLLESTVLFCKSQMKLSGLKVDRVMLCGGGAALAGLDRYLAKGMGVPVELFDPWRVVDTSALDPDSADLLDEYKLESVVALGLATTASSPQAYSIEILPSAIRSRREFWGGKVFLIAAALLAVAFLVGYGVRQSSDLAALEQTVASLSREYNTKDRQHRRTEQLVRENERVAELTDEMFALKGSGEQVARVLREINTELPQELWLTRLVVAPGVDPELGVENSRPRPIVRLQGRARQGTQSVVQVFQALVEALRTGLPSELRMKERLSSNSSTFSIDLTYLAPPADGAGTGPQEQQPGG